MEERYFYHSFRRIRPNENVESALGMSLAILEAISKVGLILAPEVVEWKIPLADKTTKQVRYRQTRICFTELSRPELANHAKSFGPISLEFPLGVLRRAAALPVIYVPPAVSDDEQMSSAGAVIVWVFDMIRHTLDQLEALRKMSDPLHALEIVRRENPAATNFAENYTLNLQNQNDDKVIEREFPVEAKIVRGILDYIGYKNAPIELMLGAVHAAQTLFYPTDDHLHNELMAYYRQREWRMIPGFAAGGTQNSRPLSENEKNMLIAIDERFWMRELRDDKGALGELTKPMSSRDCKTNPSRKWLKRCSCHLPHTIGQRLASAIVSKRLRD